MSDTGNRAAGSTRARRSRWLGRRLAIALLVAVIGAAGAMAGMEWYTGQPKFCGSCHIMQPYYQSWSVDVHATKAGAACIDCHYAPGERHTYPGEAAWPLADGHVLFGAGRGAAPRPHVQDSSCLREGCHKVDGLHRQGSTRSRT